MPAKPWNSELVSPNVAKILAKRRDRVRAVFERRLARIDRVRPKFLKRDKQEIRINTGVPKAAKGEPDNALPRETEPPLDCQSTQVFLVIMIYI